MLIFVVTKNCCCHLLTLHASIITGAQNRFQKKRLMYNKSYMPQQMILQYVILFLKAPLYTKLTLMDCGIGNTNLLGSSSSGLGYDCFYMKSTDGATMYFNLGSGIGSGRFQTDYWVKLRVKDEKNFCLQWDLNSQYLVYESTAPPTEL